jgi:hypothetical protein
LITVALVYEFDRVVDVAFGMDLHEHLGTHWLSSAAT